METDEQLMAAVARGDMDAFEDLVRRHQQTALNVAYRFLGNQGDAEDAAQEAFLRILDRAAAYRPTAKFRTYLCSIVTRLCIDTYRKKRPRPAEDLGLAEDRQDTPSEALAREESARLVRKAVDALPPRQRAALVLKHFEQMSYVEIAGALGCSERAVESLLVRAKQKLKKSLRKLQW